MTRQRYKETGAVIVAIAVISAAAISGAMMMERHIPTENAQNLPPAPYRGLPFTLEEQHLTDWPGMSGGATAGARKVKTTSIPAIGTPLPAMRSRTPVEEINARWPREDGK